MPAGRRRRRAGRRPGDGCWPPAARGWAWAAAGSGCWSRSGVAGQHPGERRAVPRTTGCVSPSAARTSCFSVRSRSAWISSCKIRSPGSDSQAGKRVAATGENREKSSQKASMSSWCGQTTTSGPAAVRTNSAATSAHADPQTPSSVAGCPRDSADTAPANPSCSFRRRASSRKRSDAALASDEPVIVAKWHCSVWNPTPVDRWSWGISPWGVGFVGRVGPVGLA